VYAPAFVELRLAPTRYALALIVYARAFAELRLAALWDEEGLLSF